MTSVDDAATAENDPAENDPAENDPAPNASEGEFFLTSAGLTHVGQRRSRNEDTFLCDDELGLWLVADGMGGHAGGDVASRETAQAVLCEVMRVKETHPDWDELSNQVLERNLERAVQAAAYMVFSLAEFELERLGMGTTLSAMARGGPRMITAQVGDSRIYRRRESRVELLTEDHTWINWQLRHGRMTREDALKSPKRNVITRAVGHKDHVEVDTCCHELSGGDRFLLCSDGLHGYLEDAELPSLLDGAPELVVQRLVELANERGGKDNITAVVVDVTGPTAPTQLPTIPAPDGG